jgi:putative transposase
MLKERRDDRRSSVFNLGDPMTNYRRADFEGGYYFFTVVTYKRRRFLTSELARGCLRAAWEQARQRDYFDIVALCLLPDHLHCVWKLPDGDHDFSLRWSRIKAGFTRRYCDAGGTEYAQSSSRNRKRERGIWQRRFWEHRIRDEEELQRHIDYIHYNPVKHGLVDLISDWPWSTYHRYVRERLYRRDYWHDVKGDLDEIDAGE